MKVIYEFDPDNDAPTLREYQRIGELISIEDALQRYARHLRKHCDRDEIPTDEVADKLFEILRGDYP